MEQKRLKELFSLTCTHTHFLSGIAGLFEMEPIEETQKTLRGHQLTFKRKKDGFVIVAAHKLESINGFEPIVPFGDDVKLSFAIFTTDARFFDYSDLPYDPPGRYIYYFNNLDESQPRTTILLGVGGVTEDYRIKLNTKTFTFAQSDSESINIYDVHGNLIPQAEYDSKIDTIKNQYIVIIFHTIKSL